MKRRINEMSLREQIGAAAKYGAYSPTFADVGFRSPISGDEVPVPPEAFEAWISGFSETNVNPLVKPLVDSQPTSPILEKLSEPALLKLRAFLALRLGDAQFKTTDEKELALTRTYPRLAGATPQNPYRDGSVGHRLTVTDRKRLFDQIAKQLSLQLSAESPDLGQPETSPDGDYREDFIILSAFDTYTLPGKPGDVRQFVRIVEVEAQRDGVTEYRASALDLYKGYSLPELVSAGGYLDRVVPTVQRNSPGAEFQVVFPFARPLKLGDVRTFAWVLQTTVGDDFFQSANHQPAVGFRPSRELRAARLVIKFPESGAPSVVAINSAVPIELRDRYDLTVDKEDVVNRQVEVNWPDPAKGRPAPRVGRWSVAVWPI